MTTAISWQQRIWAYSFILPRWFAVPAAVASVALGGVLTGQPPGVIALSSLAGALLMAYAHTWNSFHDWASGFDQGPETERSHEKPYTGGQNLIARGVVSLGETYRVAVFYLGISAAITVLLALATTPWVWLPWLMVALCAPLYSWGKRTYTCELWLALGFGPLAVMFGAAVGPGPEMLRAFLAGIPFGLVFGYMAEVVDQYLDADVNVPKGLRNLGALCWRKGWGLGGPLFLMALITAGVHGALVGAQVLSSVTVLTVLILPAIAALAPSYEKKQKAGIMAGLALVLLYPLAILVVEALR
jgi:1,4-dihydroxy-2-naphthoate octaprenyltransferase